MVISTKMLKITLCSNPKRYDCFTFRPKTLWENGRKRVRFIFITSVVTYIFKPCLKKSCIIRSLLICIDGLSLKEIKLVS